MSRLTRTLTRALTAALPLALGAALVAAPADAAPARYPDTVALPTGSLPEGITAGPDDTFFAGARSDGAVRQYSTATGELLRTVVPGREGEVTVGLQYDPATDRIYAAGGATGDLDVYDARTGALLYTAATEAGFVNDVTVTDDSAWFTDSSSPTLLRIPLGPGGTLPAAGVFEPVTVTGAYVQPQGFGLNGIRELPSGDLLVVSGGVLYAVDPATGVAEVVEQRGRALAAGDGLELLGGTLYVVNGYGGDEVAVLRLSPDGTSTQAVGVLRDRTLDRPTTAAVVSGALYAVNGRFETLETDADAEVYVTRLPLR